MNALGWLWLAFIGLWKAAGSETPKPDAEAISLAVLLYTGIAFLVFGHTQPVPRPILFSVVALFIIAAFARYELGGNFYGKREHVESGPYALVSHPIYMAVGFAALLTAIAYKSPQAYLGAGAVIVAVTAKAVEEQTNG